MTGVTADTVTSKTERYSQTRLCACEECQAQQDLLEFSTKWARSGGYRWKVRILEPLCIPGPFSSVCLTRMLSTALTAFSVTNFLYCPLEALLLSSHFQFSRGVHWEKKKLLFRSLFYHKLCHWYAICEEQGYLKVC